MYSQKHEGEFNVKNLTLILLLLSLTAPVPQKVQFHSAKTKFNFVMDLFDQGLAASITKL